MDEYTDRIRELEAENEQLRDENAVLRHDLGMKPDEVIEDVAAHAEDARRQWREADTLQQIREQYRKDLSDG